MSLIKFYSKLVESLKNATRLEVIVTLYPSKYDDTS